MRKTTVAAALIIAAILAASAVVAEAFLAPADTPGAGESTPPPSGTGEQSSGGAGATDVTALDGREAAEILETIGFYTASDAEATDAGLTAALTRQDLAVLTARALGFTAAAPDPAYPDPFEDTAEFTSGAVGFLLARGVVENGSGRFSPSEPVTRRELLTTAVRALGVDPGGRDITEAADPRLTAGYDSSNLEGIADGGDAARVLLRLLCMTPAGDTKTVLARLCEAGELSRDAAAAAGLGEYLAGLDEGCVTARYALEKYGSAVLDVQSLDLMLRELGRGSGTVIAQGVAVVPLELLPGASYLKLRDSHGSDVEFDGVLGVDDSAGLAYVACGAADPLLGAAFTGDTAGEDGASTVYTVSVSAVPGSRGAVCARRALPVMGARGEFVGVTADTGVVAPAIPTGEAEDLFDLNRRLWPDKAAPFRGRGIDPEKPMTAITYDDGPSAYVTPQILDLLEREGAVATFFEVGVNLKDYTGSLQRMEDLGCEVANHTYAHKDLNTLGAESIKEQVENVNTIISGVLGHGAGLVRPPYGNANSNVRVNVSYPLICWNVDTMDWDSKDPQKIFRKVTQESSLDGDIILMHSIYTTTLEGSELILPWLREQGYQTVTVSELAYFRGVELKPGSIYYCFPKD